MEKGRKVAESKIVVETNEYDVFLGRGKNSFYRTGNVNFRKLSLEMARHHEETRGRETKVQLAKEVVAKIKSLGGRFLRPVTASNASGDELRGAFEIVSEEVALTKTKQAIRDAGTARRRSKTVAHKQALLSRGAAGDGGAPLEPLGAVSASNAQPVDLESLEASLRNPNFLMPQIHQPFAAMPLPTPNFLSYDPNTLARLGAVAQSSMLPTPQVPATPFATSFPSQQQILAMLPMIAQSQLEQQQSLQQHRSTNLAGSLLSPNINPYGFLSQANQTQNAGANPLLPLPFISQQTPTNELCIGGPSGAPPYDELKPPAVASALNINTAKRSEDGFPPEPIPGNALVQKQGKGLLAAAAAQDHNDPLLLATDESTNFGSTIPPGRSGASPLSTAFENNTTAGQGSQSDNSSSHQDASSTHSTLSEATRGAGG